MCSDPCRSPTTLPAPPSLLPFCSLGASLCSQLQKAALGFFIWVCDRRPNFIGSSDNLVGWSLATRSTTPHPTPRICKWMCSHRWEIHIQQHHAGITQILLYPPILSTGHKINCKQPSDLLSLSNVLTKSVPKNSLLALVLLFSLFNQYFLWCPIRVSIFLKFPILVIFLCVFYCTDLKQCCCWYQLFKLVSVMLPSNLMIRMQNRCFT